MNWSRFTRHVFSMPGAVNRCLDEHALREIEQAIEASERAHGGEIRFAVEANLSPLEVIRGVTPRDRAIDCFARTGVWDTESNNGVLIYLLLADRDVEIVADRGFNNRVTAAEWTDICHTMEHAFARGAYKDGVVAGVHAVGELMQRHYPATDRNELPNTPLVV